MPIAKAFGGGACPPCPPSPPTGASWVVVKELDLTGLDSQSITGSGTLTTTLAKSGVPYADVVTSTNASTYDFSAGAGGITYNTMTGTGTANATFDLTNVLSKTASSSLTFDDWEDPVCVMFQINNVTWGSIYQDLIVGFAEVTTQPAISTVSFGWRVNYDNVDNNYQARRYIGTASDTNCFVNEPPTSTITFAIIVHAGLITEMWASPGGTSIPSDPRTLVKGPYSAGYTGVAGGSMPLALNAGFCPNFSVVRTGAGTDAAFTLSKIGVYRWQ